MVRMRLTDDEKRMLEGENGFVAQKCIEAVIREGEAAGAEHLLDIDGITDFHLPGLPQNIPLEEIIKEIEKGKKFKAVTFSNKFGGGVIIDGWEKCGVCPANDAAERDKIIRPDVMDAMYKLGLIPMHTCAYYLSTTYWPTVGQHCANNESSSLPWINAVLGARTNHNGSFQASYIGKTPAYDMQLTENRAAKILIRTEETMADEMEWDMLGWAIGEYCEMEVPAIIGAGKPTTTDLVKFNSSACTGGEIRMYHIIGITPEAMTIENAFQGKKPREEVFIERRDLKKVYDMMNTYTTDKVDFVYMGCPHYNIVELQKVTQMFEGKKVKVPTWVMTTPWIYMMAEKLGYKEIIEKTGAILLSGACPGMIGKVPEGAKVMAVDAVKQDFYITGRYPNNPLQLCYGTKQDCVNAAITGKWSGQWK